MIPVAVIIVLAAVYAIVPIACMIVALASMVSAKQKSAMLRRCLKECRMLRESEQKVRDNEELLAQELSISTRRLNEKIHEAEQARLDSESYGLLLDMYTAAVTQHCINIPNVSNNAMFEPERPKFTLTVDNATFEIDNTAPVVN
jgi:hypothetical protein